MIPASVQVELAERLLGGHDQGAVIVWAAVERACELFGCGLDGRCNCRSRISVALMALEGGEAFVEVLSADADTARELVALVAALETGAPLAGAASTD